MYPINRKMARLARRALADSRALEEEAERFNPVGAGKHTLMDHLEHPTKAYGKPKKSKKVVESESEDDMEHGVEAGRMLRKHIEEIHGGAYLHKFLSGMTASGVSGGRVVGGMNTGAYEGEGKKAKRVVGCGDKRRTRGELISKLMKEHGMTLGEASKHIKEHGTE
jgi:hypothetical protein